MSKELDVGTRVHLPDPRSIGSTMTAPHGYGTITAIDPPQFEAGMRHVTVLLDSGETRTVGELFVKLESEAQNA